MANIRKRRTKVRALLIESLERREMLTAYWQNPARPLDVNNDIFVTPLDALLIINRLNNPQAGALLGHRDNSLDVYFDTSGDAYATPLDALLVINAINSGNATNLYVTPRVPNGSSPGPAGLVSRTLVQMPGESGESMELAVRLQDMNREFHEVGVVPVDGPDGSIDGISPWQQEYPHKVFADPEKQVLFSRYDTARSESRALFGGGQWVAIYVLQTSSNASDPREHIDSEPGLDQFTITWQELRGNTTPEFAPYRDSRLTATIRPVNRHPTIHSVPNRIISDTSNYLYPVKATDADSDPLHFQLLAAPAGMEIDPFDGLISWPAVSSTLGRHFVELEVADARGGFRRQAFDLEVVESLPNRPPIILSEPLLIHQLEPASAAYATQSLSFTNWQAVDFGDWPYASNWTLSHNEQSATHEVYSQPTMILSDFQTSNSRFEGQLQSNYYFGGGRTGIVFGYEDSQHFYLLDWKQYDSVDGLALEGMSVKRFAADRPLTPEDFHPTEVPSDVGELLFHNSLSWDRTLYSLSLEQHIDQVVITVRTADETLATIALNLPGLPAGRVGFFAFEQGPTTFSDFRLKPLGGQGYRYQIDAYDADADNLVYRLVDGPRDASLSSTGQLTWQPTFQDVGDHKFSIQIADGRGGVANQEFVLCVLPLHGNGAPRIISQPIVDFDTLASPGPYRYQVQAIDAENDHLSYVLLEAPVGMRIDSQTGLIIWENADARNQPLEFLGGPRSIAVGAGGVATVEVLVSDITGGSDRQRFNLYVYGGTSASIGGYLYEDLNRNSLLDTNFVVGDSPYVVFSIDDSCSMDDLFLGEAVGDLNHDDLFDTRFDVALHGIQLLLASLAANSRRADAQISIVTFSGSLDMNPALDGHQYFTTLFADADDDGVRDIDQVLRQLITGCGGTDYEQGLRSALDAFDSLGPNHALNQNVVFISDGVPERSGPYEDEVEELRQRSVNLQALGIGIGTLTEALQSVDPHARELAYTKQVVETFTGLDITSFESLEPALAGWTVFLDENANGVLDGTEQRTVTDASGYYQFDDLAPGLQRNVRVVMPAGWQLISPGLSSYQLFPFAGESIRSANFGFLATPNNSANRPPIFSSAPPTTAISGEPFEFQFKATDPEAGQVTYTFVLAPSNVTLHPEEGTFLWKPHVNQVGRHNFVVRASDSGGASSDMRFVLEVVQPNRPPVVTSSPPLVWIEDRENLYQIQAVDPERHPISFEVVDGPYDFSVSSGGLARWRPDTSIEGILFSDAATAHWNFNSVLADGIVLDSTPSQLHGLASNDVSSIAGPRSLSGNALWFGENYGQIAFPDTAIFMPQRFSIEAWIRPQESSWGYVFDRQYDQDSLGVGISLVGGTVRFGANRSYLYTDLVLDQWSHVVGVFDRTEYRLYVNGQLVEHDLFLGRYLHGTLDFAAGGQNFGVDDLAYFQHALSDAQIRSHYLGKIQSPRTATVAVRDALGAATDYRIEMVVSDGSTNAPPRIIHALPSSVGVSQTLSTTIKVSDDNAGAIQFSLVSAPSGMSLNQQGVVTWQPTLNQIGRHSYELLVTDSLGATDRWSATIEVVTSDNAEPLAMRSTPGSMALVGQVYHYQPATNRMADTILWTLHAGPAGMVIDPAMGTLRWLPTSPLPESFLVKITATDSARNQVSQSWNLNVACFNTAPRITSYPQVLTRANELYRYHLTATDSHQDSLTWELAHGPAGMELTNAGELVWTPNHSQVGLHDVIVSASDGSSATSQRFTLQVLDPITSNRAPVFTSTPRYFAATGVGYSYQLAANDPEGSAISFSADDGLPSGMTLDASGLVLWTPNATQAGRYVVSFRANDQLGASATQAFVIQVQQDLPPRITSAPITSIQAGAEYLYLVKAYDPEGSVLSYQLENAPVGLSIDPGGRITWRAGAPGTTHSVTVRVSDSRGQSALQTWTIETLEDTTAPRVGLTVLVGNRSHATDTTLNLGTTYRVRVSATDNVEVSNKRLTVNGKVVLLDQAGLATLHAETIGIVHLEATAEDSSGLRTTRTLTVTVVDPAVANAPLPTDPTLPPHPGFDPADRGIPIIAITSPAGAATVSNLVPIIGTVDDPEDNLWFYRVYIGRADRVDLAELDLDDPDWRLIKTSTHEVHNDELAVFDASSVSNDPYVIAVAAFDVNGLGYIQPTLVYVEGNLTLGNFQFTITDLSVPLAGIPIQVSRTYSTHNSMDLGDFGYGWTLAISDPRIFEATAVGAGGAFNPGNDKFVPDRTKVYLNNPAGQRVGFTYKERFVIGGLFGAVFTPYFAPDPGVYDQLLIDETQVFRGLIAGDFGQGINPQAYTLVTKDGLRYRYDDSAGLESIEDRHGNIVRVTPRGMTHSNGQSIRFVRDQHERIVRIIDPAGNTLEYAYDTSGDLRTVTDQMELQTRFVYRSDIPHYLDKAIDSLGKTIFEVRYDQQGRYIGIVDALGNQQNQEFQTSGNFGVIRDALGNATSIYYDDRGNVLREVDPLGRETVRQYGDPRNPELETRVVDRNGNMTLHSYDERGNLLTLTVAGPQSNPFPTPNVTTLLYAADNQVEAITNATGSTTTFRYSESGLLTSLTNALGDRTLFTYDNQGRRASHTDFNGNTTRFEYDAACPCGSPSKVIYADGTYATYIYNHFGQATEQATFEADGTLVEIIQTDFDASGRVIETRFGIAGNAEHPQTVIRKFYEGHLLVWEVNIHPDSLDDQGRLLESPATPISQRKSRITQYQYDAADRIIRQIDAQGAVVEYRYDANGNRILLQDPVGNITTWVYDALQRVVEERDPFYNAGLAIPQALAALSQPSGADLTRDLGAAHVRAFAYDGVGNQIESIDRNGRRREFDYDAQGRRIGERWFAAGSNILVETLSFTYDVLGKMLTANDSNSGYRYAYDDLSRLKSVDNNPVGTHDIPRVILSYSYDAQGNRILTQDDSGVTVASTYDSRNRLNVRTWYDEVISQGDLAKINSLRVEFDYSATGRELETRRYSSLDSLNLVGRSWRTYDTAGRSDLLIHTNTVDELLAGYDYDYDFGGLVIRESRTHQNAQYAQQIDYRYDLTGQLVDAWFSGQDNEHFVYDTNGNRISSMRGNETRNYATGSANQLLTDGVHRYEYDGEGNQVKRIHLASGQTRTMEYDHRNRLIRVADWTADPGDGNNSTTSATLTQNVIYKYDIFGRRIERRADMDGAGPIGIVRQFSVYDAHDVWLEYDDSGSVEARYLYGDKIDQQIGSWTKHDSTIWNLTDQAGTAHDRLSMDSHVLVHHAYGTFGLPLNGVAGLGAERFGFTGREYDAATEQLYYRARYMDPITGRFNSNDPIGYSAGDANLYRYVGNSSVNLVDPTGTVSTGLGITLAVVTLTVLVGAPVLAGQVPQFLDSCEAGFRRDFNSEFQFSSALEKSLIVSTALSGLGLVVLAATAPAIVIAATANPKTFGTMASSLGLPTGSPGDLITPLACIGLAFIDYTFFGNDGTA